MTRWILFFLFLATSSIVPAVAQAHHDPNEMEGIFAGFAHLPAVVWVILLAVLGILVMAIVVVIVAKPKKDSS